MNQIFFIDRRKNLSIDQQIYASLKNYVLDISTAPGTVLPNPKDIAKEFELDVKLIESFYQTLMDDLYIEKVNNDYLKATNSNSLFNQLFEVDFPKHLSLKEMEKGRTTLSMEIVDHVNFKKVREFEVTDSYLKICNLVDFGNSRKAYLEVYVSTTAFPKDKMEAFSNTSIIHTLKEFYTEPVVNERYTSVKRCKNEIYERLEVALDTPLISTLQFMINNYNEVITYSEMHTNHEFFFSFKKLPYII